MDVALTRAFEGAFQKYEAHEDKKKPEADAKKRNDRNTLRWIACYTIFAALATGVSFCQLQEIRDQAMTAKDTETRQLRAYVGVQSVIVRPLVAGHPISADLTVRNFGVTPASTVQVSGQPSGEVNPDFSDAALDRLGYTTPESLFPTAERIISVTGTKDVEGPNQMEDALHPSRAPMLSTQDVLVYGLVRYRDVFNDPHFTEFCYTVSPGRIGHATSTACQEHNRSN